MMLSSQRVSLSELSLFTRQLALMLRAGITITSALDTLTNHKRSNALHHALTCLQNAIYEGETIAAGMRYSPLCFPSFYTTLIAAGEQAGILDQTLDTVSEQLEAQRALRSRMIRAAIYPTIVCVTLAFIVLFLLTWVVPTFQELFAESGIPLPWLTQVVISISTLMSQRWPLITALLCSVLALCIWLTTRSHSTVYILERLIMRVPIWNSLIRAKYSSECSALLAALTRVGIPLLEGLLITAQTAQNSLARAEIHSIYLQVSEGSSLSTAFRQSPFFPEMLSQLLEVGENSGNIEAMLGKASSFYRSEVEQTIDTLKQLVEPALILTIGAIVGTTVLALYLPIFQIGELAGMR